MIMKPQSEPALPFRWGEHWCHAHPYAGLFIEGPDILVISDLHLEKASHFALKGQFAPPYDTSATLLKIEALLTKFNPQTVISLGDSFHDEGALARMLPEDTLWLRTLVQRQNWIWVTGNHDKSQMGFDGSMAVKDYKHSIFIFRHEAQAIPDAALHEVSGHLHPCATIKQRSRHLRRRCFVFNDHRLIMPALGSLTGSLNVRDIAFAGFFTGRDPNVILLGDASAHLFPLHACLKAR